MPLRSEPRASNANEHALLEHVHSYLWMLETLLPYLRQLRVLVLKCASVVQRTEKYFYFYITNKLEYVNYRLFQKGGVRIIGYTN